MTETIVQSADNFTCEESDQADEMPAEALSFQCHMLLCGVSNNSSSQALRQVKSKRKQARPARLATAATLS